ncbi:hypothetical protein B0J14DRAFT_350796 [Halenospora varia]|nr:hypothetical protein B0J14DRAFT_350796 [Halenospora varia]
MMITKRLGYNYIWIDSLCIIQDSPNDWISESAIMGQIYRNSTCNLASLGAVDSNGGCFTTRNPLLYRPCRLNGDDQSALYAFGYGDPEEHYQSSSRLASRAWVFQERMLSPRALYYGVTGISWECVSCSATESLPDGVQGVGEDDARDETPKRALLGIDASLTQERFRKEWGQILATYSRCNLTKETDRLAAIHGVVKELRARLDGAVYLAGIWMDDPLFCLLWETNEPGHHRRNTSYTAPTWSWASVNTSVDASLQPTGKWGEENFRGMSVWVTYDLREVAQIIETTVTPAHDGTRDNGQVSYGHIVFNAPYRHVTWDDFRRPAHASRNSRATNDRFLPDFRYSRFKLDEIWAVLLCTGFPKTFSRDLQDSGLDIEARIDIGLALGRVETADGRNNVFKRVGYFEQYYWRGDENIIFSRPHVESRNLILL